ncbi:MAG: NAD(P)H-dependent oxidoreductase [Candidatus Gracilibacteria bacterium]|nr:NAD(P)H-dependent oxidoreductase [Candidatus Gracilibacteria bacterium]
MKTLYIKSSPRGERSKSIELGNHIIEKIGGEVIHLDLFNSYIPFLSEGVIAYNYGFGEYEGLSSEDKKIADVQKEYIDQIKSSDNIVIAAPMWNFGLPGALKTWFDLVLKINDTFAIENGNYIGLVKNIKKTIVVGARGGKYIDTPFAPYDNLTGPINLLLGFIGLEAKNFWLEGVNYASGEQLALESLNIKGEIDSFIAA